MKFEKQIEGVPMELVRQGWRRETALAIDDAWRAGSRSHRWDYEYIESGDAVLRIARPVIQVPDGPRVYAHAGWGDGLAPTPEMVKVWKWWWVSDSPVHVRFVNGSMVVQHPFADSIESHTHEWRGPVLPPMEG